MRCDPMDRHGVRRPRPRRALITVAVLVCLLVITLICGGLLRLARSQRGLLTSEERRLQADWLAESGLERAAARLGIDRDYRGETWSPSAVDLGGGSPGVVSIQVKPRQDEPDRRLISVQADYPSEPSRRVRSRKQAVIDLGPERAEERP